MSETPVVRCFHAGITVSNLERSLSFYRDLLGLELLFERVYAEPYILRIVNVPGTEALKVAVLQIPGSHFRIELLEYEGDVARRQSPPIPPNEPGTGHLALVVRDIGETWERLRSAGVRARSDGPVRIDAGPNAGGLGLYVFDPDGYHVELHQRPREKGGLLERLCFTFEIRPGMEAEYKRRHDEIWPELVEAIKESGLSNFSLFRRGTKVIAYVECEPDVATAFGKLGPLDVNQRWAKWFLDDGVIETLTDETGNLMRADEVWHLS